ncbi:MAG: hypothetical protein HQK53_20390, partial [Oligoflexia bacterium]|nr:hypothetical protein [Oligoflexia bacterium]
KIRISTLRKQAEEQIAFAYDYLPKPFQSDASGVRPDNLTTILKKLAGKNLSEAHRKKCTVAVPGGDSYATSVEDTLLAKKLALEAARPVPSKTAAEVHPVPSAPIQIHLSATTLPVAAAAAAAAPPTATLQQTVAVPASALPEPTLASSSAPALPSSEIDSAEKKRLCDGGLINKVKEIVDETRASFNEITAQCQQPERLSKCVSDKLQTAKQNCLNNKCVSKDKCIRTLIESRCRLSCMNDEGSPRCKGCLLNANIQDCELREKQCKESKEAECIAEAEIKASNCQKQCLAQGPKDIYVRNKNYEQRRQNKALAIGEEGPNVWEKIKVDLSIYELGILSAKSGQYDEAAGFGGFPLSIEFYENYRKMLGCDPRPQGDPQGYLPEEKEIMSKELEKEFRKVQEITVGTEEVEEALRYLLGDLSKLALKIEEDGSAHAHSLRYNMEKEIKKRQVIQIMPIWKKSIADNYRMPTKIPSITMAKALIAGGMQGELAYSTQASINRAEKCKVLAVDEGWLRNIISTVLNDIGYEYSKKEGPAGKAKEVQENIYSLCSKFFAQQLSNPASKSGKNVPTQP